MKRALKKIYGLAAVIALACGATGAFAYSAASKAVDNNRLGLFDTNKSTESGEPVTLEENLANKPETRGPMQYIDLTDAAEKACNAVVYIKVVMNSKTRTVESYDPFEDFFNDFFGRGNGGGTQRRQIQTPKQTAAGSGVIISSDGYIVTNNHVVANADEITVTLNDNREFTAKVIGKDADTDLALIKVDAEDLPTLPIGDSDALKVGEWVLAVGNPFNLTSTVTAGIVSAKARHLGASSTGIESFIQTDAAINQGNSGGALVNARGELVGINAMLYSQTGSFSGYGFAIPTTIMKKVVADFKEYGTVQRALLGISGTDVNVYIDSEKAKDEHADIDLGTNKGVYVVEVSEDGAAKAAGIEKGDVIISVDGREITKMSELQEATTKYRPGDKILVGFLRNKKEKTATLTLKNAAGTTNVVKSNNLSMLGGEFKPITDKQKENLNLSYGLQVSKLKDGLLKDAGIREGFIILKANNQNIRKIEDLESAFKSASNSAEQTLWIWGKDPSGKSQSYAIQLSDE